MIGYHQYKREKTTNMPFYNMIFVGVCIGVVFFIIYAKWIAYDGKTWNVAGMMEQLERGNKAYLYYVMKQRLKDIIVILFVTFLLGHKKSSEIGVILMGTFSGVLLCMCMQRFVLSGIVLWLAYQLPQYICYVFALYLWGKMEQVYPVYLNEFGYNKMYCLKKMTQYIMILLLVMAGILLECYVNTEIMEKMIKIFKYE